MKRQVPGFAATVEDSRPPWPTASTLSVSTMPSTAGTRRNRSMYFGCRFRAQRVCRTAHHQPAVLHLEGDVEAGLVSARFPL